MAPVITLLSDLGTRDAATANVKAMIARRLPLTRVADVSHIVRRDDLPQAAYLLSTSYHHFPKGSVHIVMIDVLSGTNPKLLLHERQGQYIIAPDNGILPLAFGEQPDDVKLCAAFDERVSFAIWAEAAISTAQKIISGDAISLPVHDRLKKRTKPAIIPTTNGIDCSICYIDRYGNIILDITQRQFEEIVGDNPFRIRVMRKDVTSISKLYSDVEHGDPLCRFNDSGYLEIALNGASVADLLGLGANNQGNLHYQTMKIFLRDQDL